MYMSFINHHRYKFSQSVSCSNVISNKEMHALNGNIHSNCLKLAHLNIQGGLIHKKAEIETVLQNQAPHILGLSETNQNQRDNIDYSDTMFDFIPGWTYSKEKTRVGILIRKGIKFKLRKDLMKRLLLPTVWIEILDKGKKVAIINTYREHRMVGIENNEETKTGGEQLSRWAHFVQFWERSLMECDETWLLGDINLEPKSLHCNDPGSYYKRKMYGLVEERIHSKGVVQLVSAPTWYSSDGKVSSCIDHIYTNSSRYTNVINHRCFSSDHNLVMVTRKGSASAVRNQYRTQRNMSSFSKDDFCYILNNLDLDPILSVQSPETQVQMLTAALEVAADITAPFATFSVKKNHTKWLSPEIRDLMQQRDAWFTEFQRTRSTVDHQKYRTLKNQVNREISKAKQRYYAKETNNVQDAKQVWTKLNEVYGRNSSFSDPIVIHKDNTVYDDPQQIAELFNGFYQEKVRKIIQELPTGPKPRVHTPPGPAFNFHKVGVKEVRKHIFSLTNSTATGHDGISNVLLKAGNVVIAPILTRIINNCIRTSSFPDTWKVGKITVLYKKGTKTELNNYRPITLLCSLSKVLEKVLFKQIISYFNDKQLMDPRQYGFRPGRSCVHAVIDYLTTVLHGKGEVGYNRINALLIDLSAAFDTVGHELMLDKLKNYGFGPFAIKLMESYLHGRTVYTEVENRHSQLIEDLYGVPQGSILGPLLYVIFVISLKETGDFPKIAYADDTTALTRAHTDVELDQKTNDAMASLIEFFAGSGLKLNNTKTELINHNGRDTSVQVDHQGTSQSSVKSARLLGIIIDSNLNFHSHIDLFLSDLEYRMWCFKKVTKVADLRNRIIYGHGMLFSKFVFGIQCYSGTDATYLNKVRVAYDKCTRLVFGPNPDGLTTAQIRSKLGILSFQSLSQLMDLTLLKDILDSKEPEEISKFLDITYSRNHPYGRVRVNVIPKSEKFRRSFIFRAAGLWNSLPNQFKILRKQQFHDSVKAFMLGDFNGPG